MDTTTRAASPLRQRMLEDMRMRKLEPRTQEAYIRAVRKLSAFLKRPPDTATVERLGQLMSYGEPATEAHLAAEKAGAPALLVMPRLGTVSPWAWRKVAVSCASSWLRSVRNTSL